jgi:hypothetical protein
MPMMIARKKPKYPFRHYSRRGRMDPTNWHPSRPIANPDRH